MTEPGPRKRSRIACTSCQSRKRKCSGDQPCSTCVQLGAASDCHYDIQSRKKKDLKAFRLSVGQSSIHRPNNVADESPRPPSQDQSTTTPGDSASIPLSSLEANSGAAFVRRLGLKLDAANAPRLHLFAWNVGARHPPPSTMPPPTSVAPVPIVDIISQEEMRTLMTFFLEKVDMCYPFLDRDAVLRHVSRRWLPPSSESALAYGPYDAVLCGVAAIGYLFSRRRAVPAEYQLAETARLILEHSLPSETPVSVDMITGWVLRVAYLRMTASPHAAWMASCSLMHLIEASGLHLEALPDAVLNPTTAPCAPETRRRLFGMARHLNVWISFELGRSRVVLHGATSLPPAPRSPNGPSEIFNLLPVSESLDPNKTQDAPGLEATLANILDIAHIQAPLILAQCNLMLCIYRRLRALNSIISGALLDRVLALAAKGLRAAREMVASICPWHQIANVPFQVVCTLLAIDTRAALALLADAMRTLRNVAAAYDTDVMREAYSTAYLLILLHQRRKEEDTRALRDVLRVNASASASAPTTATTSTSASTSTPQPNLSAGQQQQQQQQQLQQSLPPPRSGRQDSAEFSWLGELMIDMPSLQNFDLEQFLMTDVPWPLPEMGI
ncbi:putative C6 transcription factor [Aspergillus clavatus NRRL 1]|uniref:C6 transcription factor, putative n=1 Tax=Aspergillus clavatus (strain ATCC 1007 / CBS 513.65 / DSM 816 / NCTC 3887 / NRRL 1 / QM 1276 / 107) TaxID=344612 RepID=A1CA23_ASPCL|nr:C6 transcription factor, putative [Aspergillus clavatus NRRL 1]EAW12591.1 C6 transcription factor, putative [Aspergillus clavatus NRRL 1]